MEFPGGVWPVMITPYNHSGQVDDKALRSLVEWYIQHGVKGLFAVCQSSEMFFLSFEERLHVARVVVDAAGGRVPVIASGHTSDSMQDQAHELNEMAKTGVDAVILITNRLAAEGESDVVWLDNCTKLMDMIDKEIPLGFYECPYPYKRLLTLENMNVLKDTERFYFLKDTCCDIELIKKRLEVLEGSRLKLYNANTTTLLESLQQGAAGYSGVMANFHPELYAYICEHYNDGREETVSLSEFLTMASLIERQCYPVNAKYFLRKFEKLDVTTVCRTRAQELLTDTFKTEIQMLDSMTKRYEQNYIHTAQQQPLTGLR